MSEAKHRPTAEQPAVTPTVSTDPGRSRWDWSAVPSHLGRARTSTVILGVLFLAIGALYLNIRPETTVTPAGTTGNTVEETVPTAPAPTTAPQTTTAPETTSEDVPTETTAPTATTLPTDTTVPTDTTEPTPTLPTPSPSTIPNTSPSSPTP